jgi:hypothetical protein
MVPSPGCIGEAREAATLRVWATHLGFMENGMTLDEIQGKLETLKATTANLETQIQDKKVKRALRLDVASNWLGDVERLYIPKARDPKFPANARIFLDLAEFSLAHAESVLAAAKKMHDDYGGNLTVIE